MNDSTSDRVIRFEGAKNVRDLGGLSTVSGARTRYGSVYRSDGLSRLTDGDLEVLASLEIHSIIDLRYEEERERAPDRLPPDHSFEVFVRGFLPKGSLEMFDGVNNRGADADAAFKLMRSNYARIPYEHAAEFKDVMHHVIQPSAAPHLIHCTSGKDRTGIVAAFILLAVGVSIAEVVADYELSNGEWQPVDVFGPKANPEAVDMVMSARTEYIVAAIEAIDCQSGSFDAYLRDYLAFEAPERGRLRTLMLE